jgi:hypothetical protein
MKKKQPDKPNTEFTVLNDEFANLKPRMLDRLYRVRRVPQNAHMLATIEEAIWRIERLR